MWRLVFPVLSYVLLAAHVMYHGFGLGVVAAVLLLNGLLFVPRSWARTANTILLVLAGAEWVRTAVALVHERMMMGRSWTTALVILLGCAFFTWFGAWLLHHRALSGWYRTGSRSNA